MRALFTPLALVLVVVLWLWGLVLGRPWPVQLVLGLPAWHEVAPGADPPVARHLRRQGQASPSVALTPQAGAAVVTARLACAPTRLTVQTPQAFGARRGLDGLALGWRGRDDGYGVLKPHEPPSQLTLESRGMVPQATVQLTSLGGLFDGTGTLEVTPQCDD